MIHLYRVILPVNDIEAAEAFYTSILGTTGKRASKGRHYFDCAGTILACFDPRADGDGYDAAPNPETLYFSVKDLASVYEACNQAGGSFAEASPPSIGPMGRIGKRPWGEESFYIQDPF